jgi:YidC/Oxa1 family membrane protein insertase
MKLISTVLPYVTVVIAAVMPLAACLYLITTVAWSTAERWLFTHLTSPKSAGAGHAPLGLHCHLD